MPSNEDLYREMEREEEEAARMYRTEPPKAQPRKLVNEAVARERFQKEIAPVIARQKRALAGRPITRNPILNAWLKLTGKDKVPMPEVFDPVFGIAKQKGMTVDEVRAEIIAHPELYPDLAKKPPERPKKQ